MKVFQAVVLLTFLLARCESGGDAGNGGTSPHTEDNGTNPDGVDTIAADDLDGIMNSEETGKDQGLEEDSDVGDDLWVPVDLVMPGKYVRELDGKEKQIEQKFGIPEVACASGHHFGAFSPLGGLCVDDPHALSLSLCKDHANDPACSGTTASGQVYLCDCGALGAQFGEEIKSWCQDFGHPQSECDTGGVRVEFCEQEQYPNCTSPYPLVYKKLIN